MNPRYRILLYNRTTDRLDGAVDIPQPLLHQVLAIAGVTTSANELGEYPLNAEQVRDISPLLGFEADPSRFHYHLDRFE